MTDVRVSQVAVEVIRTNNAVSVQLSQLAVEVLRPNAGITHTASVTDTLTSTDAGSAARSSGLTLTDSAGLTVATDTEIIAASTGTTYEEVCTDALIASISGPVGALKSYATALAPVLGTDAAAAALPMTASALDRMNLWGIADHQESPSLDGGDPRWPYLEFLFHCDSIGGLDTLVDSGPYSYSQTLSGYATNNALIDTAVKKYGDGSLRLTGAVTAASPYNSLGYVPPITVTPPIGTGDLTFEFFVRPVDYGWPGGSASLSFNTLMYIGHSSYGGDYLTVYQQYTSGLGLDVYKYNGGTWTPGETVTTTTALNPDIWYHVAVTKQGDSYKLYVDGALVCSTTVAGLDLANSTVIVGNEPELQRWGYNGRFDEIRLSRMVRYVEPFTAPTEAFLGISPAMAAAVYTLMSSFAFTDAATYDMTYSRTAAAQMALSRSVAVQFFFKPSMVDGVITAEQIASSWPMQLAESLGVDPSVVVARAHRVIEALGLAPILAPRTSYTRALSDSVQALDLLARFVGGAVVDGVVTADLASRAARLTPVATDPLALADDVSRKLVIRLVSSEGVDLTSAQALKLLLNPTLAETVTISLAYIAPGDTVTTWAVNTRTGATTEYTGYDFNSFAEFGRSYVAASSSGLYELRGDTDDSTDIIAKIKSGLGQFAGSRLTHIKAAYIGVRGSGDFLLNIETTDGKTHTYGLTVGSMKTHKVNMGKGIRARYFAYELESTGQDFDLENIKFVPLIAQRRV